MKVYWGEWKYSSTHSWPWHLHGCEWSASRSGRFTLRERTPGTHWIRGAVDPRAGLDAVLKLKIPCHCTLLINLPTLFVMPLTLKKEAWTFFEASVIFSVFIKCCYTQTNALNVESCMVLVYFKALPGNLYGETVENHDQDRLPAAQLSNPSSLQ
jgi:hypothetical protein